MSSFVLFSILRNLLYLIEGTPLLADFTPESLGTHLHFEVNKYPRRWPGGDDG